MSFFPIDTASVQLVHSCSCVLNTQLWSTMWCIYWSRSNFFHYAFFYPVFFPFGLKCVENLYYFFVDRHACRLMVLSRQTEILYTSVFGWNIAIWALYAMLCLHTSCGVVYVTSRSLILLWESDTQITNTHIFLQQIMAAKLEPRSRCCCCKFHDEKSLRSACVIFNRSSFFYLANHWFAYNFVLKYCITQLHTREESNINILCVFYCFIWRISYLMISKIPSGQL